jgi:2-C-methyl-D-erythritol 4-phosphate cytidylyltransferase
MEKELTRYTIIVAGGSGQRMKSSVPKQFIELAGRPILMHTIEKFHSFDEKMLIIVVLPADYISKWKELCNKFSFCISHLVTQGGETRFYSVKNGLAKIPDKGLVAIHDGVRPFVSHDTIAHCFETATQYGNAVPCVPIYETIRQETPDGNRMIDRSQLKSVQTPQVFSIPMLKKAFNQPFDPAFTDDASVLERTGEKIKLVEGNPENIKVTEPVDWVFAEGLLSIELTNRK